MKQFRKYLFLGSALLLSTAAAQAVITITYSGTITQNGASDTPGIAGGTMDVVATIQETDTYIDGGTLLVIPATASFTISGGTPNDGAYNLQANVGAVIASPDSAGAQLVGSTAGGQTFTDWVAVNLSGVDVTDSFTITAAAAAGASGAVVGGNPAVSHFGPTSAADGSISFGDGGSNVYQLDSITVTAIPEPTTVAAILGGAAFAVILLSRHRLRSR